MEKEQKKIYFVSWKKHKVDQALLQVDNLCNKFIDELLFESIIDFFKKSYGYTHAFPISKIIQNDPVISPLPENLDYFETQSIPRLQKCPICDQPIDASRFTYHLISKCFIECKDKMDVLRKYFDSVPLQNSNNAT